MNQKAAADMFICMNLHIIYNDNKTLTVCAGTSKNKLNRDQGLGQAASTGIPMDAFFLVFMPLFSHVAVTKTASGVQLF